MNTWLGFTGWGLFAVAAGILTWIVWQLGRAFDEAFGWG